MSPLGFPKITGNQVSQPETLATHWCDRGCLRRSGGRRVWRPGSGGRWWGRATGAARCCGKKSPASLPPPSAPPAARTLWPPSARTDLPRRSEPGNKGEIRTCHDDDQWLFDGWLTFGVCRWWWIDGWIVGWMINEWWFMGDWWWIDWRMMMMMNYKDYLLTTWQYHWGLQQSHFSAQTPYKHTIHIIGYVDKWHTNKGHICETEPLSLFYPAISIK